MKKYIVDFFTNVGVLHIIASIILVVLVNVFIFPPNDAADIITNLVSGIAGATIGVHLNRIITKKYLKP